LIISPKNIEKKRVFNPRLPISKTYANRLHLLQFIANEKYQIPHHLSSLKYELPNDVRIMDECLQKLSDNKSSSAVFNVEDAGTVARFLTALLSTQEGHWELYGSERMHQRPMAELIRVLRELGAEIYCIEKEGYLPIRIKGKTLRGETVIVNADVSSQYISALLLISPLLKEKLILKMESPIFSLPYIDLTIEILSEFNIKVERKESQISVFPSILKRKKLLIEKDWSASAVWFLAMLTDVFEEVFLEGLKKEDKQGDVFLIKIYEEFGIISQETTKGIRLLQDKTAKAKKEYFFNLQHYPDLFPSLVVSIIILSATAEISGLKNLDLKESKRLTEIVSQMNKNGFCVEKIRDDSIKIKSSTFNKRKLRFDCKNDHRLIMAFSMFGLICPIELKNTERVEKSYPSFWEEMDKLVERSIS